MDRSDKHGLVPRGRGREKPGEGGLDVGEILEEEIRTLRLESLARVLPRGHGHRHRAEVARAFDVPWRVTDDDDLIRSERHADQGVGAARGERGKLPAVVMVRAVGAEREIRQEARRLELDPGARLDISGEQPQEHIPVAVEAPHEIGDAGERDHGAAVADLGGQPPGIGLEAVVEPLAHRLALEAGALHQVEDDAGVRLAAKVVGVDVSGRPVDVLEGDGEGPPSGAARDQDSAVDIEEDEAHGAQRGAGSASERSRATMGGSRSITASTSAAVLQRPMVKQREPSISCGAQPMARSTCDGVPVRWAHAEPEDAATPQRSRSRSTLSALAPRRTRLTWWGRRARREPVSRQSETDPN